MTDAPKAIWAWRGSDRFTGELQDGGGWLPEGEGLDGDEVHYTRTDTMPTWQPIETAPKDGNPFLMGWPGYVTEMAMWDCGTKQFVRSVWQRGAKEGDEHTPDPLDVSDAHWMPLPAPPST